MQLLINIADIRDRRDPLNARQLSDFRPTTQFNELRPIPTRLQNRMCGTENIIMFFSPQFFYPVIPGLGKVSTSESKNGQDPKIELLNYKYPLLITKVT
jgi:hypothetical protein